eukprot:COSAG02_NODE_14634_length_1252_cov_1.515178_1_plen_365_part_01
MYTLTRESHCESQSSVIAVNAEPRRTTIESRATNAGRARRRARGRAARKRTEPHYSCTRTLEVRCRNSRRGQRGKRYRRVASGWQTQYKKGLPATSSSSSSMRRQQQFAGQPEEGMLGRMSLELLQEILVKLPLRARLQPAVSAKFLWLAASSPMTADGQAAASSPLGALLPPRGLGAPRAWTAAPTDTLHTTGHAIFPPSRVSKCGHWLLTGNTYTVVPTPKGNPKTLKNFALAGGGTGVLRGETKWSGLNYIRGVHIVDDMVLAPRSEVTFVGCRIDGYIKQLGNGSLTLIDCTLVRVSRSEQSGSSTLGMSINMHSLGDPGVKVGNKGKLTMLGCRITGPRDKPDIAARNFSEIDIQDCIFE